jgi:hypothetical protein
MSVSEITEKLRKIKVNQYSKLYELSKETKQKSQMQHALRCLMEYKGDITPEMEKDLKQMPVATRDIRHPLAYGGTGYTTKWVYGDMKSFNTFTTKVEAHKYTDTYGEKSYTSDVPMQIVEFSASEITNSKIIKEIQDKIISIDKRCGRKPSLIGDSYVEKAIAGEIVTFKITCLDKLVESEFGYIIVQGIPGKKGYIVLTIIDTDHCKKCNINPQSLSRSANRCITSMLEMLNSSYITKSKEVF